MNKNKYDCLNKTWSKLSSTEKKIFKTKEDYNFEKDKLAALRKKRRFFKEKLAKIETKDCKAIAIKKLRIRGLLEFFPTYGGDVHFIHSDKIDFKTVKYVYEYGKKWNKYGFTLYVHCNLLKNRFLSIDGVPCVYKKQHGNLIFVDVIKKRGFSYSLQSAVVYTDGTNSSHGKNAHDAYKSYQKKLKILREEGKIKNLTLDSEIDANDYHKITGACKFGINEFCEKNGISRKKKFTVKEVLDLTVGQYGHDKLKTLVNGE